MGDAEAREKLAKATAAVAKTVQDIDDEEGENIVDEEAEL